MNTYQNSEFELRRDIKVGKLQEWNKLFLTSLNSFSNIKWEKI